MAFARVSQVSRSLLVVAVAWVDGEKDRKRLSQHNGRNEACEGWQRQAEAEAGPLHSQVCAAAAASQRAAMPAPEDEDLALRAEGGARDRPATRRIAPALHRAMRCTAEQQYSAAERTGLVGIGAREAYRCANARLLRD